MENEQQAKVRFLAATVDATVVPVNARQQDSARRLIRAGWCGYGSDRVELIGRPVKSRNGGRVWGAAGVEREKVAA